jgi:hypothetical protein
MEDRGLVRIAASTIIGARGYLSAAYVAERVALASERGDWLSVEAWQDIGDAVAQMLAASVAAPPNPRQAKRPPRRAAPCS